MPSICSVTYVSEIAQYVERSPHMQLQSRPICLNYTSIKKVTCNVSFPTMCKLLLLIAIECMTTKTRIHQAEECKLTAVTFRSKGTREYIGVEQSEEQLKHSCFLSALFRRMQFSQGRQKVADSDDPKVIPPFIYH